MEQRRARDSKCIRTSRVFPSDVNNHDTLFGGKLMSFIDDIASISASRHSRYAVVTASTDSVDFLQPIRPEDFVYLESYVTWTGKTSMEVFVKVIREDLMTGDRKIAATSFLTFVALNEEGEPMLVPKVIPETEEEKKMYETGAGRAENRRYRRKESQKLAHVITELYPWEDNE